MSVGSSGTVSSANGIFTITDASGKTQQVDLGTLMMMLNLDRTENLDKQIALQLDDIQKRNDTIKQLTEFLSQARQSKSAGWDDGCANGSNSNDGHGKMTINGVTKSIQGTGGWAETLGITWTDVINARPSDKDKAAKWDAVWDANIANIKSKIDTLNNDSQMDNIKLQNLLEKRGNAFEMASKVMDTNNQSVQATVRNL
jgi:hypothetical protein